MLSHTSSRFQLAIGIQTPKKAAAMHEEVTVSLPAALIQRIERITGSTIEEFLVEKAVTHFDDERRTQIELRDFSISWTIELYDAMLDRFGDRGVAPYVRDTVYRELSKTEKGLIPPPEWKQSRAKVKKRARRRKKTKSYGDRTSCVRQTMLPEDWMSRLESKHEHPGRWIKAKVQARMERETGKQYPVQRGMKNYLPRP